MDLSIILLNYNTAALSKKCLDTIATSDLGSYKIEIIFVDNASTDNSIDTFKTWATDHKHSQKPIFKASATNHKHSQKPTFKTHLIDNPQNLGFAAANNRGIRQAKGKYLLLLNSDVLLTPTTLKTQLDFMHHNPQYAASTCRLLTPKNPLTPEEFKTVTTPADLDQNNLTLDPACHRGFPTPWASFTYFTKLEKLLPKTKFFGQYHQGWQNLTKPHAVQAISGAFFMIEKTILDQVGLFDEGFFMYAEDLDLCLRIHQAGYHIGFNPQAIALHLKGSSGRALQTIQQSTTPNTQQDKSKASYHFYHTMQLFYDKHYAPTHPKLFNWFIHKLIASKKSNHA